MNPQGSTAAGATPIAPPGGFQEGGWYNGMQYHNGSFGAPGVVNQPGAVGNGQAVSAEVNQQSSVAQGKDPNAIARYLGQGNPSATGMAGGVGGVQNGVGVGGGSGFNLQGIYDSALTNNPDYIKVTQDITAREKAHNDALAGANDNPFYSEGRRLGEQAKIDTAYNNDMKVLTAQKTELEATAAQKVKLAQDQYNINRQEYQDTLSNFDTLVKSGGLDGASTTDLANYAVMTGIPISMLKSIQAKSTSTGSASGNPQIITSTDSNGNLNIVAVNKATGEPISTHTIPGAGKSSGSTAPTVQNFNETATKAQGFAAPNGTFVGVFPQLVKQYAPFMSLQDIYKNYLNTDIGKQYGAPQESAGDIKTIYDFYRTGQQPIQ